MSTSRYTVGPGQEFSYPADKTSLQIVKNAGGLRKLTPDQRSLVKYKTVVEGEDCSDMDPTVLELYLNRGWIVEHKTTEKSKGKAKSDETKEGN